MNELVVKEKAPLDELMLAMDVVDTLRHKELVLARELQAEDRDERLLEQLREIYTSQGIVVTDEVLAQGVTALREERFAYPQPATELLAYVGVRVCDARPLGQGGRRRRGRGRRCRDCVSGVRARAGAAASDAKRRPSSRRRTKAIDAISDDPAALDAARAQLATGEAAIAQGDYGAARAAIAELETLNFRLNLEYDLRVVSRPGEQSGVWREPEVNRSARNYYLIVEAVPPRGGPLRIPVTSEEDGRTRAVSAWGLRVDEATFNRVAADKRDDGIIQDNVVGRKRRGVLDREYTVPTTGAAITEW